MISETVKFLSS